MAEPAFYARRGGRAAQWWTLLHPPYTLWHLSYAVAGAALAPSLSWAMLGATVLAFFLAVGVAAHALDELRDRPLRTTIAGSTLWGVAGGCLAAAVVIGVLAVPHAGALLVPCIAIGVLLVFGYNLELFGGRLHSDLWFAISWGAFPVVVGYVAQAPPLAGRVAAGALALAAAATALSYAQRQLSTPARLLRRRTADVGGVLVGMDGTAHPLDRAALLAPLEGTLKAMSVAVPLLAVALLLARVAG